MSHFDCDVLVAGAGPAGSLAARTLAAAGAKVLLVERGGFPRNKPCGGGITVRAEQRFPWLRSALAGIDVHTVRRLHLEGPAGAKLDLESDDPCVLLVRRLEFDHALSREAQRSGAVLVENFEITQVSTDSRGVTLRSRDGRRLSAPFVIAADGVHSVVAKRLGVHTSWPRTALAIDMMEETPVETLAPRDPDVLWVAYAHNGLDGYAYVFPKTRHTNVGLGCILDYFDRAVTQKPYELQRDFVASLVSRHVLDGRSDRQCFTPYLIPVGGPLPSAGQGRVLFAGDAGGFVHALTAEGIYYAMVTGELAGRALLEVTSGTMNAQAVRARYDRAWQNELGAELADAVLAQRYLFMNHGRVGRVIRGAQESSVLTELILDYVKGKRPYRAVRRRLLWRFPLAILRMLRDRRGGNLHARAS